MALDSLRKGVSRTLGLILVALLVLSFAVWGIADIFTGYGQQTLIKVGDTSVTPQDYLRVQQDVLRTMSQEKRRSLSLQEARAEGLDSRVLERLVGGAAVDTHANHLGLRIGDDILREQILNDPAFKDAAGNFSPLAYQSSLRNINMTEASYLRNLREHSLRRQLLLTVGDVAASPQALIDALNQFNEERRILNYVLVRKSAAKPVGDPTEDELKTFYDNHKTTFTKPEYRKVAVIAVTPETVKDELNITEDDLRATYESKKDTLGDAETRAVQQIALPNMEEAKKVAEKIKSGTDFIEVAETLGLSEADIDIGTVKRSDMVDPVIADEVFKLEKDTVSEPITGKLGSVVLVRVTEITPGKQPTFEEAKGDIENGILKDRASGAIFDLHDLVEDELAAGSTLEEAAAKLKINYQVFDQIDRQGLTPEGKLIEVPAQKDFLNGVFATDAGIENDPIDARDEGVVWYEVLGVTPETVTPFDDVRSEVETAWRADATRNQVSRFTQELVTELSNGSKTLEEVATELGTDVLPTSALKRDDITVNVLPAAVQQAFSLPTGGYGSADSGVDDGRIVFEVVKIVAPPEVDERALSDLKRRIGFVLSEDMIAEYFSALETTYGVEVNQAALSKIVGNGEEQ